MNSIPIYYIFSTIDSQLQQAHLLLAEERAERAELHRDMCMGMFSLIDSYTHNGGEISESEKDRLSELERFYDDVTSRIDDIIFDTK